MLAEAECRAAELWNCRTPITSVIGEQAALITDYGRRSYWRACERASFPFVVEPGVLRRDCDLVIARQSL